MKQNILLLISIIAFVFALYNQVLVRNLSNQNQQLTKELEKIRHHSSEEKEEVELAVIMGRMQIHFDKLWFAGSNENWDLAGFYIHELEESLEELEENNITEDDIDISNLVKVMTERPFQKLENSIKQKQLDAFKTDYQNMMKTCNSCHQASNHGFIQLQIPSKPSVGNQIYQTK